MNVELQRAFAPALLESLTLSELRELERLLVAEIHRTKHARGFVMPEEPRPVVDYFAHERQAAAEARERVQSRFDEIGAALHRNLRAVRNELEHRRVHGV